MKKTVLLFPILLAFAVVMFTGCKQLQDKANDIKNLAVEVNKSQTATIVFWTDTIDAAKVTKAFTLDPNDNTKNMLGLSMGEVQYGSTVSPIKLDQILDLNNTDSKQNLVRDGKLRDYIKSMVINDLTFTPDDDQTKPEDPNRNGFYNYEYIRIEYMIEVVDPINGTVIIPGNKVIVPNEEINDDQTFSKTVKLDDKFLDPPTNTKPATMFLSQYVQKSANFPTPAAPYDIATDPENRYRITKINFNFFGKLKQSFNGAGTILPTRYKVVAKVDATAEFPANQ
jgi:hypothetical protein